MSGSRFLCILVYLFIVFFFLLLSCFQIYNLQHNPCPTFSHSLPLIFFFSLFFFFCFFVVFVCFSVGLFFFFFIFVLFTRHFFLLSHDSLSSLSWYIFCSSAFFCFFVFVVWSVGSVFCIFNIIFS